MNESGENYLETILVLTNRMGAVRSIDIARELGYSKPSVSRAVGLLKADGFINTDTDGNIRLTDKGKEKAAGIFERHQLLTEFLATTAGVSREIAEADACRIEHIISQETFQGIVAYLHNI